MLIRRMILKDNLTRYFVFANILVSNLIATNIFALFVDVNDNVFFSLGDNSFYAPWQIFKWFYFYSNDNNERYFYISFGIGFLVFILFIIFYSRIISFRNNTLSNIHGSSRFMNNRELKDNGYLEPKGLIYGETNNAKYSFNKKNKSYIKKKYGKLIFDDNPVHNLVVARTRGGKGISYVVPNCLFWKGSLFAYDIKKELWDLTSGYRSLFTHVLRFEPSSPTSVKWNPLLEIEKGDQEVPMAQNIVEVICYSSNDDDKFWVPAAKQFLVASFIHVLYASKNKSIGTVLDIINNPNLSLDDTLNKMMTTNHLGDKPHPVVAQSCRSLIDSSPNIKGGIIKSVTTYLTLWDDPNVRKNTETSDFSLRDLMYSKNPVSLYLVISPADQARMKPLVRLMIELIGKKLTQSVTGDYNYPLHMMIDEFVSLDRMDYIEKLMSHSAGYGITLSLIIQSYSQLFKLYGQKNAIIDNCYNQIVLGVSEIDSAKYISERLGKMTLKQTSTSKSKRKTSVVSSNVSESESETGRAILTPDEVLRLPFDKTLLLLGGQNPYDASKIMFFNDKRFKDLVNLKRPDTLEEQLKELPNKFVNCWDGIYCDDISIDISDHEDPELKEPSYKKQFKGAEII